MTRWTWINYKMTLAVDTVHAIILMPWCTSSSGNVNVKWSEMLSIFPDKENRDKLSDCLTNKCWYNIWIQYIFQTLRTSAVSVQWTLLLSELLLGISSGCAGHLWNRWEVRTRQTTFTSCSTLLGCCHGNISLKAEHEYLLSLTCIWDHLLPACLALSSICCCDSIFFCLLSS